jgi:hypothetical protein
MKESWLRRHFMPTCYCCGRHTAAFKTDSQHYMSSCGPCLFYLSAHIKQKDVNWPRREPAPPLHWRPITFWMKLRYVVSMIIENTRLDLHTSRRINTGLWAHRIRGRQWSIG